MRTDFVVIEAGHALGGTYRQRAGYRCSTELVKLSCSTAMGKDCEGSASLVSVWDYLQEVCLTVLNFQ